MNRRCGGPPRIGFPDGSRAGRGPGPSQSDAAENGLDAPVRAGLLTPLPRRPQGGCGGELRPGKLLEILRDRVIHRSQIGRRKLDRAATRRRLDEALRELGRRYRLALEGGVMQVPDDLAPAVEEVRSLEQRLARQEKDIADLEEQRPSGDR